MKTGKRLLTIKEFCYVARISRTSLYRHLKSGEIPHTRIGSRVLISADVIDLIAEQAGETKNERTE